MRKGPRLAPGMERPSTHQKGDRREDIERPECDNERGKPHIGYEDTVDESGDSSHTESDQQREPPWEAEMPRQLADDHRHEDHDGAHRQVDAGRQDHERLSDGQGPDDRHLLEDKREVRGLKETRTCPGEGHQSHEEHKKRADFRMAMKSALDALHRCHRSPSECLGSATCF